MGSGKTAVSSAQAPFDTVDPMGGLLAGPCMGTLPQAASIPTIRQFNTVHRSRFMSLLLLEALGAMVLLLLIVWWTMFSGRKHGELPPPPASAGEDTADSSSSAEKP